MSENDKGALIGTLIGIVFWICVAYFSAVSNACFDEHCIVETVEESNG